GEWSPPLRKSPLVKHLVSFRRMVFMVFKEGVGELNAVFKFTVDDFDYNIFVSSDTDIKCFKCGQTGHLAQACPERQSDPGVSERPGRDAAEPAGVIPPAATVRPAAEGPGAAAAPDLTESEPQAQPAAQKPTGAMPAPEKPRSARPDGKKPWSTEKSSVGSGAVLEPPELTEAGTEVQGDRMETPDTTPARGDVDMVDEPVFKVPNKRKKQGKGQGKNQAKKETKVEEGESDSDDRISDSVLTFDSQEEQINVVYSAEDIKEFLRNTKWQKNVALEEFFLDRKHFIHDVKFFRREGAFLDYTLNVTRDIVRSLKALEIEVVEATGDRGHIEALKSKKMKNAKMNDLLDITAQGALVRSRFKSAAEMDAPSKFFFSLEQKNGQKSSEWSGAQVVEDSFLVDLPKLSERAARELDRELSLEELHEALQRMENVRASGQDVLDVLRDSIRRVELPLSCRRAVLTLLPKKGDLTHLKNWRPVSLLCTDCKLLSKALASRLTKVLSSAKVNWAKSEAILVGEWGGERPTLPGGLVWKKDGFKYLGVYLGNNEFLNKNWEGTVEHVKGRLSRWKRLVPRMSYRGRTLVINNLAASSLWHKLACVDPPPNLLASIQALLVDFLWDGLHWIPQSVLHLPKEEGGQGLVQKRNKGCGTLHWLLEEPLIHGGRLDISGVTAPALSRAFISSRVVTLWELVNIAGTDLSRAEDLAARLGLRSLRVVNQLLRRWRTVLTSKERVQLMDYQITETKPAEEGSFPQLDIAPDLDGSEGLLLECWGVREMDFGSVLGKLLYRACVKVLNKKKLSGRVDTPWRSVLGFNADIKPEWTHCINHR
ncbi:hypothetical protein QTP86_028172, partial [Hemibagrus guttatus]